LIYFDLNGIDPATIRSEQTGLILGGTKAKGVFFRSLVVTVRGINYFKNKCGAGIAE
jgi:hypothetical protein